MVRGGAILGRLPIWLRDKFDRMEQLRPTRATSRLALALPLQVTKRMLPVPESDTEFDTEYTTLLGGDVLPESFSDRSKLAHEALARARATPAAVGAVGAVTVATVATVAAVAAAAPTSSRTPPSATAVAAAAAFLAVDRLPLFLLRPALAVAVAADTVGCVPPAETADGLLAERGAEPVDAAAAAATADRPQRAQPSAVRPIAFCKWRPCSPSQAVASAADAAAAAAAAASSSAADAALAARVRPLEAAAAAALAAARAATTAASTSATQLPSHATEASTRNPATAAAAATPAAVPTPTVAAVTAPAPPMSVAVVHRVLRLERAGGAVDRGELDVDDLYDELLLSVFQGLRCQHLEFRSRFYAPNGDAIVQAFCAEHTDKNFVQARSEASRPRPPLPAICPQSARNLLGPGPRSTRP